MAIPIKPVPAQVPALITRQEILAPVKTGGIRRREPKASIVTEDIEVYGELGAVASHIKSHFGPRVIVRGSAPDVDYGRLASGILVVDLCLAGGIRLSRGSMFYGNKSAGKSTLAGRFVAAAQRMFPEKVAVYIDIEGTLDKPWLRLQGVNLDRLLIVEPESGEAAVDIADAVIRAQETSIVVSDSIAMLVPMKEIQGSSEDSFPAIQARLVGTYLRKLNASLIADITRLFCILISSVCR
jgi:recombination protein RecA